MSRDKGTCSVERCERPTKHRGWCGRHYQRWLRHGDPLAGPNRFATPAEALRVNVREDGDCLLWLGSKDAHGYGRFHRKRAHRVAWELANGPVPDGLHICHSCDTPACVNAAHLFVGTHADNMADMSRKGRSPSKRGAESPTAKLTEDDVRLIRESSKSGRALARELGVTHYAVQQVRLGRSWAHVD